MISLRRSRLYSSSSSFIRRRLAEMKALSTETGVPLIAINDALYATPEDRPLQDILTCIREKTTIHKAGRLLAANAERHLKLRLACTLTGRSAQQLVTDAIDRLLDELPDVAALAAQVTAKPHNS